MPDETGANRDEIARAIETLTAGELLKLKSSAVYRVRGLGRAACGRTDEDLLGEAWLAVLSGAANNGSGRHWKGNIDLPILMKGAMRSISSHWKRDFDEQEADLESEILTPNEGGRVASPIDNVASNAPSQERELAARQQCNDIASRCHRDAAARKVLEGLSGGLTPGGVMSAYGLSRSEYQKIMKRLRRRTRDNDRS